jgi:hypothetical protein
MKIKVSLWPGLVLLAGIALLLPSCATDGNFTILGYSTCPNYDRNIHTVRVPIFKSRTLFSVLPVPGLEMDLTRAVIREIESKTPYKVVSDGDADTELTGVITSFTKVPILHNQLNETREAETTMTVEVTWRDLRTGEVLSRRARRPNEPRGPEFRPPAEVFDPLLLSQNQPLIPATPSLPGIEGSLDGPLTPAELEPLPGQECPPEPDPAVVVTSLGYFRPELGESITTSMQRNVDNMATQIVSMMESPW